MSRVLAVDTSTIWSAVALIEGEGPGSDVTVAECVVLANKAHAALMIPLIDSVFQLAGWDRDAVDAYAALRGPGSFTGIRVGLGVVRGLSLAAGKPCFGVGTLDAMAASVGPEEAERVPLLEAGRDEVYGARFDATDFPPRPILAPWVGPVALALRDGPEPVVIGGMGRREELRRAGGFRGPRVVPGPVASAAGRIARFLLDAGAADGTGMEPLYVRPSDAEVHPR